MSGPNQLPNASCDIARRGPSCAGGCPLAAPCPACSSILDSLDGAAVHVRQRAGLAVVAKSPIDRILRVAAERGWRRLRFVSSHGTTYNRDYLGETAGGDQRHRLNVFLRDGDAIRHHWCSEDLPADPDQEPRITDPRRPRRRPGFSRPELSELAMSKRVVFPRASPERLTGGT